MSTPSRGVTPGLPTNSGSFKSTEKAGAGVALAPATSDYVTLEREADTAYDREDQAWFDSQSTEDLKALWAQACDINRGASWDDEVYEALAKRGHFDEETASEQVPAPDTCRKCGFPGELCAQGECGESCKGGPGCDNRTDPVTGKAYCGGPRTLVTGTTCEHGAARPHLVTDHDDQTDAASTRACAGCGRQTPVELLGGTGKCSECVGVDTHNYRALHDGRMRRREYNYADEEN